MKDKKKNKNSNFLCALLATVRKSPRTEKKKQNGAISEDIVKSEKEKIKKLNGLLSELLTLEAELKKYDIHLEVKKKTS